MKLHLLSVNIGSWRCLYYDQRYLTRSHKARCLPSILLQMPPLYSLCESIKNQLMNQRPEVMLPTGPPCFVWNESCLPWSILVSCADLCFCRLGGPLLSFREIWCCHFWDPRFSSLSSSGRLRSLPKVRTTFAYGLKGPILKIVTKRPSSTHLWANADHFALQDDDLGGITRRLPVFAERAAP